MANPEHLAILKQGVKVWNQWRQHHPDTQPDLSEEDFREWTLPAVDLAQSYLDGASFFRADLSGGKLVGSSARNANLAWADISRADLSVADLSGGYFGGAEATGANLAGAKLLRAGFYGTNLQYANFTGSTLDQSSFRGSELANAQFARASSNGTTFANVDLSEVIGLETISHVGPSTIGIDTIYKSKGKIPEAFLVGCGVPDEFIAYIGSIVGRPVEFYSCFISYSTKDQQFADRLHADLQAKGGRCWFAPHNMKTGEKILNQIDEAIRLHDKLLLILSEQSMASKWVTVELRRALDREVKEGRAVLFPARLADFEALRRWEKIDSTGNDLAEEIRQRSICDFSNWKDHDAYQRAFQRLLADLKNEAVGQQEKRA